MNELAHLAKKELRDVRVQTSMLILEGPAWCGLLPADPQLADNAQPEVRHGA